MKSMEPIMIYAAIVACVWALYFLERWSARQAKSAAPSASLEIMERLTTLKIKMNTQGVSVADIKQLQSELAGEGGAK